MHALWAKDLCTLPSAFDIFLVRSQDAPLHMAVDSYGQSNDHILEMSSRLLHKIGHLRFDLTPILGTEHAIRFLHALRDSPLLSVQSMLLAINDIPVSPSDPPLIIPRDPFDAPSLRSLTVRALLVPFRAPNLETLDVHRCDDLTLERLCHILREVPNLRHLTWSNPDPKTWRTQIETDIGPHLDPVQLPQLRSLDVVDMCPGLLLLNHTLVHPPLHPTGLKPVCIGMYHYPDHWPTTHTDIAETCTALRPRLPVYTARANALTIPFSFSFCMACHVLLSDVWDPTSQSYHDFGHTIFGSTWSGETCRRWVPPLATLIKGVTSSLAPDISHVYILGRIPIHKPDRVYYPGEPADTMHEALIALPNVKELYVSYESRGIFHALCCSSPSSDEHGVVFPLLDTIVMDNFGTEKHRGWSERTTQFNYEGNYNIEKWQAGHLPDKWWINFCDMLESRASHGHKLQRLILRGRTCHIAVYMGWDSEKRQKIGLLRAIDLQKLSEWVDEVVDEREVDCGLGRDLSG
ncbi:hypothetical protein PENSPDRAFT_657282 [Peniophora sp. CONT]|nr:hypothetical protein PENSPDRAFT_657282 [Peniophora sp. CONT]